MLGDYLNQTIAWRARGSVNQYNEPTTFSSSSVPGRIVYKRRLIRLASGEEITSHAYVYTESAIKEGDEITLDSKNWTVRAVYPHVYFDGTVMGYKVVL